MTYTVSVVGAGVMGLAAAWALARRGHRVTVYEQGPVPNPHASSYDHHRFIRAAYGPRTGYMRLASDALAAWRCLWEETGETLYHPTGTLALGDGSDDWARQSAAALAENGVEVRELSPQDVAGSFPLLRADGIDSAFHFAEGGILFARRILAALQDRVIAGGGEILGDSPVADVEPGTAGIRLLNGTTIASDIAIVAAGPWISRLLPDFAARVAPSRQTLLYLAPPAASGERWTRMPAIMALDPSDGFYCFPPIAGTPLKIGLHHVDPAGAATDDRALDSEEIDALRAAGRTRFHDFEGYSITHATACYYTVEPGERFIVEPLGDRCWVMTGFSGHGFKFAALLGLELAEAVAGERNANAFAARAAGNP